MFFDQIKEIDGNIKQLRDDLVGIGKSTDVHYGHLDDIAAHIIALEAILLTVMKKIDVSADEVREQVKVLTIESTGNPEGSQKALTLVNEIMGAD
jgi:uncharacterized protein YbcI